jgi:hypothetical protein
MISSVSIDNKLFVFCAAHIHDDSFIYRSYNRRANCHIGNFDRYSHQNTTQTNDVISLSESANAKDTDMLFSFPLIDEKEQ